jgi:hypothetical protein
MAPLIQENASVIDELVPSLERHFWRRIGLYLRKCDSVDLGHAAQLDCDCLALGFIYDGASLGQRRPVGVWGASRRYNRYTFVPLLVFSRARSRYNRYFRYRFGLCSGCSDCSGPTLFDARCFAVRLRCIELKQRAHRSNLRSEEPAPSAAWIGAHPAMMPQDFEGCAHVVLTAQAPWAALQRLSKGDHLLASSLQPFEKQLRISQLGTDPSPLGQA